MQQGYFFIRQKKKFILVFFQMFFLILLFNVSFVFAEEVEFPETQIALEDISHVLTTFFPKTEGRVVFREANQLRLDLGGKTQAVPGVLFSVLRLGPPFFHPLTQEIMGYSESEIGTIQLDETSGESFLGIVVQENDPIKVGDKFRLSGVNLPLALVTQTEIDQELFGRKLAMALEETGRFRVIENPLGPTLIGSPQRGANPLDAEALRQLGKNLGVHYILLLNSKLSYPHAEVDFQLVVVPWNHLITKMSMPIKLSEEDYYILNENGLIQMVQ